METDGRRWTETGGRRGHVHRGHAALGETKEAQGSGNYRYIVPCSNPDPKLLITDPDLQNENCRW